MARYIDAQNLNGYEFGLMSPKAQKLFHGIIDEAPTEDVMPIVHGVWIDLGDTIQCSNCKTLYPKIRVDLKYYCERCGAKMDGKEVE